MSDKEMAAVDWPRVGMDPNPGTVTSDRAASVLICTVGRGTPTSEGGCGVEGPLSAN